MIDKPSIPDTLKDLKLDAGNQIIGNVSNPVNVQDAATKTYVDAVTAQIKNIENMLIDNKEFFITDVIGNHYKTVRIGSQVWMAENLKTTKFNDGSALAYPGTDNSAWLHDTTGAYAWYNNTESNKNPYGALYNWYAVKSDNLCPTGWHLPTKDEWTTLIEYMGGQSLAGGKLKETGTAHWASPNTGATNEVDFTALPGGERLNDGTFSYINAFGYYWSSTEYSSLYARYYYMYYYSGYASNSYNYKNFGYSVRCVKD